MAEIVMEWSTDHVDDSDSWRDKNYKYTGFDVKDFAPTTDISQAFQVVERMREDGWRVYFSNVDGCPVFGGNCGWMAEMQKGDVEGPEATAHSNTLPMAICKAAYKAKTDKA